MMEKTTTTTTIGEKNKIDTLVLLHCHIVLIFKKMGGGADTSFGTRYEFVAFLPNICSLFVFAADTSK